jgi:hypothetical protein
MKNSKKQWKEESKRMVPNEKDVGYCRHCSLEEKREKNNKGAKSKGSAILAREKKSSARAENPSRLPS